jgi:hypothetical protein
MNGFLAMYLPVIHRYTATWLYIFPEKIRYAAGHCISAPIIPLYSSVPNSIILFWWEENKR